ncbi:MAG TPA: flavodoxin family protein [candidate division Zixibacteria bacterium]|nr:flavodoxin family protein [candidate division Zixibacteria bacterium]
MKALLISGSPTRDGSVEILLRAVAEGVRAAIKDADIEFVRLNDLQFIPCQSCGESPEPNLCFYDDDLTPVYRSLIDCDIVVVGSPVFFDSVSAQTKSFIDRCSCFRPPDFQDVTEHNFKKLGFRRRVGGGVLVAGERGRFDLARSVLKGFFKWTEVDCLDFVTYESPDYNLQGAAADDSTALAAARELGKILADKALESTPR